MAIDPAPELLPTAPLKSWKFRLALVLTAIWILVVGGISLAVGGMIAGIIVAIAPPLLCWGTCWIVSAIPRRAKAVAPSVPHSTISESSWGRDRRFPSEGVMWLIVAIGFSLPGFAGLLFPFQTTAAEAIGRVMGYFLFLAIGAYVIGRASKRAGRLALALSTFALGAFQASNVYIDATRRELDSTSAAQTLERMAARADQLAAEAKSTTAATPSAEPAVRNSASPGIQPVARASEPYGSARFVKEAAVAVDTFLAEREAFTREFSRREGAIGLETILLPTTLATAEGRAFGRTAIQSYRELLTNAIEKEASLRRRMQLWADSMKGNLPPSDAITFEQSFGKGMANSSGLSSEFYAVERKALDLFAEVIDTVDKAEGGVSVSQEGQLLFASRDALQRYNALIQQIQVAVVEEEQIKGKIGAAQESHARNLRSSAASFRK